MSEETRLCKECNVELLISCFYKNGTRLFTTCKQCISKQRKVRYENESNILKSRVKLYRDKNKEKCANAVKRWTEANKEAVLQKAREQQKEYRNKNPHKATERRQRRRSKKSTPPFADKTKINLIYKYASHLKAKTGLDLHVDHIVPLNGKNVSGLHVEWNLRVIPREQNLAKAARIDEPFAPSELENQNFQQWMATNQ